MLPWFVRARVLPRMPMYGNGCRAAYGVEQGRIGLRRAEGDGMITTVEGAAAVGDGRPGRAH